MRLIRVLILSLVVLLPFTAFGNDYSIMYREYVERAELIHEDEWEQIHEIDDQRLVHRAWAKKGTDVCSSPTELIITQTLPFCDNSIDTTDKMVTNLKTSYIDDVDVQVIIHEQNENDVLVEFYVPGKFRMISKCWLTSFGWHHLSYLSWNTQAEEVPVDEWIDFLNRSRLLAIS